MKKIIFAVMGILCGATLSAQDRRDEWGIKAGVNFAYQVTTESHTNMQTSGHFGILREFDIHTFFAVQAEAVYSMQGAKDSRFTDRFDYLTVPVLVKFYVFPRRLSADLGVHAAYLVTAKSSEKNGHTENVRSGVKKWDTGLSAGISYRVSRNIEAAVRFNAGFIQLGGGSDYRNGVIQAGLNYRL